MIVGGLKFAPYVFWDLTLVEAQLIIVGDKERKEQEFFIQTYAMMNAIGSCFGGKKFEFMNPFKEDKKNKPQKKTREELLEELNEVKNKFIK